MVHVPTSHPLYSPQPSRPHPPLLRSTSHATPSYDDVVITPSHSSIYCLLLLLLLLLISSHHWEFVYFFYLYFWFWCRHHLFDDAVGNETSFAVSLTSTHTLAHSTNLTNHHPRQQQKKRNKWKHKLVGGVMSSSVCLDGPVHDSTPNIIPLTSRSHSDSRPAVNFLFSYFYFLGSRPQLRKNELIIILIGQIPTPGHSSPPSTDW